MVENNSETSRLADPDRAYRMLIEAHRGLSDENSAALNARLILVLLNEVASLETVEKALRLARSGYGRNRDDCVGAPED